MKAISLNNTLHGLILQAVKEPLLDVLTISTLQPRDEIDQNQQLSAIFYNYRVKNHKPTGLRLSSLGNKLLSRHFQHYKYQHGGQTNHKTIIKLDKNMIWPYYLTNAHVVFYNQQDAAWFQLNGKDLTNYTDYF